MTTGGQRYYLDANALFKFYFNPKEHGQKGVLAIRRLVANAAEPVLLSQLTILDGIDFFIVFYSTIATLFDNYMFVPAFCAAHPGYALRATSLHLSRAAGCQTARSAECRVPRGAPEPG
ncbi:MAG: type II toxin-antitoxin system VapC family toxin, partial [Gammaproteobacteria bacterium]|nr:type II toxin-antitoxin system VapC family toxin [Gammaproteobacteria bacterium]